MKIKILLLTFISLFLGSCTLTKRYHSIGYQVEWKCNKNTINQAKKSNPITVNKSTTPLLANKSLVEITDSKSEMSAITKSDVQQSLPIEQYSIAKPINVIKTNAHKILPPDSTKIVKIAAMKLKTKKRLKRLGINTLLFILIPAIIDALDGDNSSSGAIELDMSGAFFIAMMIFGLTWYLLLFIAIITWMVYLIYRLIYNQ